MYGENRCLSKIAKQYCNNGRVGTCEIQSTSIREDNYI